MQDTVTEDALTAINVYLDSNTTRLPSELFQSVRHSIVISSFVAKAVTRQPEEILTALCWHDKHASGGLKNYLFNSIKPLLFLSSANVKLEQLAQYPTTSLDDFQSQYQSETSIMALIRKVRYQHAAAIAILELNNLISIEESSARMSLLAEVLTQLAYYWSYAFQGKKYGAPGHIESSIEKNIQNQNLIILAMGKFGGSELNFSSDIDLIFFYEVDGNTRGGKRSIETNRFLSKLGIQVIRLLDEVTEDGFAFRVDMRLRPYGESGSLVMSLPQAEDYYHEQGRGWERFAMVRARAITGTAEEVSSLKAIITPFAFRRYIDYGVIDSLRNMKSMIQREVRRRNLKGNIKLGAGGIREIEFMVQSLQLIQGGRNQLLQEKNLLAVLPLLVEDKLLPEETANDLMSNYRFLRRLEHCLQELDEKQTQQLPSDNNLKLVVANLMGDSSWREFDQRLTNILSNTNRHFSEIFGAESPSGIEHNDFYQSLWEEHISIEHFKKKIALSHEDSLTFLERLNRFRNSSLVINLSSRGTSRLALFFPKLLEIGAKTNNPLVTLERVLTILKSILRRTAYLELLSENLPLLSHLVDLVSRSHWVTDRLSECPILLDELLYPNSLYQPLLSSDLASELQQSLLRIDEDDEEQLLNAIRQFKLINELRVAAAMLSERLDISEVSQYLTAIAEVIIKAGITFCWKAITAKYGHPKLNSMQTHDDIVPDLKRFGVVGYGKLGGGELGFNSDLDLVFLYSGDSNSKTNGAKPITLDRFYTRLAQKLIHFLSTRTSMGVLYEVDMRLRPSGNSGMLVSHIDAFKEYQTDRAWTWEHQALTRARMIAADTKLTQEFICLRQQVLTSKHDRERLRIDVIEMRKKMRKALDKSNVDGFDLKQGKGGLVDIEFIAQYLVLCKRRGWDSNNNEIPSSIVGMLKGGFANHKIAVEALASLADTYNVYQSFLNNTALVGQEKSAIKTLYQKQIHEVQKIWDALLEE